MAEEQNPEKAHDIDKNDPDYHIKVNEVLQRRFAEEKKKSFEREKAKMEAGRTKAPVLPASVQAVKVGTQQVTPTPPVAPPTPAQGEQRDPEEYVKRKDIVALVNNINKSFAIIEEHRIKVEAFMKVFEEFFKK
jgi:hypothetical protein